MGEGQPQGLHHIPPQVPLGLGLHPRLPRATHTVQGHHGAVWTNAAPALLGRGGAVLGQSPLLLPALPAVGGGAVAQEAGGRGGQGHVGG